MSSFGKYTDGSFSQESQVQNDISSNAVALNLTNIPYLKTAMGPVSTSMEFSTQADTPFGHWKVVQDWTACSLACGGGKQFQQRQCIPGKNPHLGCVGPTVLERVCNTAPCPTTTVIDMDAGTSTESTVKYVNVSTRPQSFIVNELM